MDIFWRLILAHLLSDFTLQTNRVTAWKRSSIWGVFFHSAIFFVVAAALTIERSSEVWVRVGPLALTGWGCITILTVLHFLEDRWRVWTISKLNTTDSLGFFLWDQFVHYLIIFIFTPLDTNITQERWVIIAIIYVIATHFLTVLIYYIRKDIFGSAVIRTEWKYYSMIERVVIISLLLLPGQWWLFMILFWVIRGIIYAFKKIYDFSWIHIMLNYFMAIILGLAGRIILHG